MKEICEKTLNYLNDGRKDEAKIIEVEDSETSRSQSALQTLRVYDAFSAIGSIILLLEEKNFAAFFNAATSKQSTNLAT